MWCLNIFCGLISGYILSTATAASLAPFRVDDVAVDHSVNMNLDHLGDMKNNTRGAETAVTGCPAKIPITKYKRIVAGRRYYAAGNNLPELSCNTASGYGDYYAETKYTASSGQCALTGSIIVNPGCTLYVFKDVNFGGAIQPLGPGTYPNPSGHGFSTGGGVPCASSLLWTCKQTYPTCIPSDSWHTISELDNTGSSVDTKFTYEKLIGTVYSMQMQESQSVSATVSAEISASFWGVTATLGVSATTGFDWSSTSTETQQKVELYNVEVMVPPRTKLQIQEVLGLCGGSKIHTQMFRIIDNKSKKMRTYMGDMDLKF